MKHKILHLYVSKRLRLIENQLIEFSKEQKPELLHRVRVNIKIIKALFSFTKYVGKISNKTLELNSIFQDAGKIRELQSHIKLLHDLPESSGFIIPDMEKEADSLTDIFVKNIPGFVQKIEKFRHTHYVKKHFPGKKTIKNYFENQVRKTNKLNKNSDRKNLHDFRKKIKKIIYIFNFLSAKMQKATRLNKNKINDLQKNIGIWHDIHLTLTFLQNLNLQINPEYMHKLMALEKKLFSGVKNKKIKLRKK
jgi:CHAD domain-containing protein